MMSISTEQTQTADPPKPALPLRRKRRWFQFGISSLMLLTLAAALVLAWVSYEKRRHESRERALAEIVAVGGEFDAVEAPAQWYDAPGFKRNHLLRISFTPQFDPPRKRRVIVNKAPIEVQPAWLRAFPEVEELNLGFCHPLSVAAGDELAKLQHLKKLEMCISPSTRTSWSPPQPLDELTLMVHGSDPLDLSELPAVKVTLIAFSPRKSTISVQNSPHVEQLSIHAECPIAMSDMPRLKTLEVENRVGPLDVRDAPALKTLILDGDPATGGLYRHDRVYPPRVPVRIRNVPALATLQGTNIHFNPDDAAQFVALEHLSLEDCTPLDLLAKQWAKLRTLTLRDSTAVVRNDNLFFNVGWFFGAARALENVERCRIVGRMPDSVDFCCPTAPRLRSLELHLLGTARQLEIGGFPELKELQLNAAGCSELTLKDMPTLEQLYVDGGWTVEMRPSLRLQSIPGVRVFQGKDIDLAHIDWAAMTKLEVVELEACDKLPSPELRARLRRLNVKTSRSEPGREFGEFISRPIPLLEGAP